MQELSKEIFGQNWIILINKKNGKNFLKEKFSMNYDRMKHLH